MEDTFEVVFVCTGNRFRSPIAAVVFAAATADRPVRTHSIGTLEMSGEPALPEARRLSSSYGLDLSSHRSRALADHRLGGADLVIGFEDKHLARAVVDGGAHMERSFLLAELVEALVGCELPAATDPVARARQLVARAAELRPDRTATMSIHDPFGGSDDEYRQSAERVRDLAARLAALLFGRGRG